MVLFLYEEPCDVRRQFGSGLVSLHLTPLFGLLRRPLQNKPFCHISQKICSLTSLLHSIVLYTLEIFKI